MAYELVIKSEGMVVNGKTDGSEALCVKTESFSEFSYNNIHLSVSLYALSFSRKVYEPGHIQAELLIKTDNQTSVPTIQEFQDLFIHRKLDLMVDSTTVAQGYYIHDITLLLETATASGGGNIYNIYTKLEIYSPDKLLTLNKYSRAYLGSKLVAEIVKSGLEGLGTEAPETEIRTMHHLSYVKSDNTREEFIHPYLVQYNESFYDFLRRVANRTGDIFYYEGGKLCFGVGGSTGASIPDGAQIGFQRISEDPLTVHDYARDTVKGFWSESYANSGEQPTVTNTVKPGSGVSQQEDIPKGTDGFPLDAFATLEQKYADDFLHFYNSEIAPDDHYMVLYKDNYARPFKNYFFKWGKYSMGYISDILNSTSLLEVISNVILKTEDLTFRSTGMYVPDKKKGEKLVKDAGGSSSAVLLYGVDDDSTQWVKLSDLYSVKTLSGEQMRKMICIDMGTGFQPFQLGETFKYNDLDSTITDDKQLTTYVVVGIEMNNGVVWQRDYEGFTGEGSHRKGVAQTLFQRVYAIPMAEGVFYPPLLPGKPFRESGPQPAFVIDSEDPTGQGRVRVRFAWQPALKDQHHIVETTSDASAKSAAQEKIQKEENATPWIRMVMPMASTGAGVFFKPVAGDEVMVDFENGNVERPFVAGSLYSKNVVTPYERAIVSRNGHSIIFRDYDDATYLVSGLNPGLKQLALWGVKFPGLEGDAREALGGIEITDKMGLYNVKLCSHNRSISIASPFGDINISALTGITIKAPNGDIRIEGKNVDVSAYNKITLTSGKNVKMALDKYSRGSFFTSLANPKQAGKAIAKTVADATYGKFFDLTLIRTLLEVLVRPVDGTLQVKSNRYLLVEAGEGNAVAEEDRYNLSWQSKANDYFMGTQSSKPKGADDEVDSLQKLIQYAWNRVNAVCQDFCKSYQYMTDNSQLLTTTAISASELQNWISTAFRQIFLNGSHKADHNLIINQVNQWHQVVNYANQHPSQNDINDMKAILLYCATVSAKFQENVYQFEHLFDEIQNTPACPMMVSVFGKDFMQNAQAVISLKNPLVPGRLPGAPAAAVAQAAHYTAKPARRHASMVNDFGFYSAVVEKVKARLNGTQQADRTFMTTPLVLRQNFIWETMIKRRLAAYIIEKCRGQNPFTYILIPMAQYQPIPARQPGGQPTPTIPSDPDLPFDDADWALYRNEIRITENPAVQTGEMRRALSDSFAATLKKLSPYETDCWKADAKGEILFSDRKNWTSHFEYSNAAVPGAAAMKTYPNAKTLDALKDALANM